MPIKTYSKGARAERELIHFLNHHGFSCIRSASSGGYFYPVDVVAIRRDITLAFEIKSWAKKPKLDKDRLARFKQWTDNAGAMAFLAWYNNNNWLFLPLKQAEENQYEDENWLKYDDFIDIFKAQ
jgi:Holliday junction resolvase